MHLKLVTSIHFLIITITSTQPACCQPQVYQSQYPVPSSQSLNCVFHSDPQTNTYDCVSTNTTVKTSGAGYNGIFGSHVSNKSNFDVNGLRITSQMCRFVPRDLGDLIPSLKKLEISYSGLLAIDYFDTYKMPNLQYLNLKGNRLVEISALVFRKTPELIFIDVSDNFIKFVAPTALDDLIGLKYIDFGNNLCVENSHPTDNIREWERELRRNCVPADKFYGLTQSLTRIAEGLEKMSWNNGYSG